MRAVWVALAAVLLAGACSGDPPVAAADRTSSEDVLRRNCADPKWREQNLGLWYSLCRQPVRW